MALALYFGPMCASKSTKLRYKLTILADIGTKCLYINHADDKRETESQSSGITTHHSEFVKMSDKITVILTKKLSKVNVSGYGAIAVDEFQFFNDPSDIETVRNWVLNDHKIVYVAALDGDFRQNTFGITWQLIPIASTVVKLNAYCIHCRDAGKKRKAPYTAKLIPDDKQKDVGGTNKYIPLCLKCYQNHMGKFDESPKIIKM